MDNLITNRIKICQEHIVVQKTETLDIYDENYNFIESYAIKWNIRGSDRLEYIEDKIKDFDRKCADIDIYDMDLSERMPKFILLFL